MIGSTVDQYQIVAQLGGGGMGQVYRALDLELDREVAIKCVRPELANLEEVTKRFRAEARTLAKLSHQNIATVYRFFSHEGQLFLVMELIKGRPFGKMLLEEGAQSPQQVVSLVDQALSGLSYAHEHKVVHRDIKPGNLMLAGSDVVKVLDFGIAHLLDGNTRLTRAGSVVGTPAYMAPEQVLGQAVDPRTDLYSLGIVLYEMLTGKLPFEANSDFEVMQAKLEQEPRPFGKLGSSIPDALQSTINRALAKDMSQRFQSAEQFSDSLHASLTTSPGKFPPDRQDSDATTIVTPLQPPQNSGQTNKQPTKVFGIAIVVALCIALVGLLFGGTQDTSTDNSDAELDLAAQANPSSSRVQQAQSSSTNTTPLTNPALTTMPAPTRGNVATADTTPGFSAEANTKPALVAGNRSTTIAPASNPQLNINAPSASVDIPVATNTPEPKSVNQPRPTSASRPAKQATSTAKPKQPLPVAYSVRPTKVSAHKTQKTGRFSRAAGYNGSFTLSGPMGDDRQIELTEFIEVRQNGQQLLRQKVGTETRKRGRFGTKKRVQELKLLPIGSYDVRLVFEANGKPIGTHEWKLTVVE